MSSHRLKTLAKMAKPYIRRGDFKMSSGQTTNWYIDSQAFMLEKRTSLYAARTLIPELDSDITSVGGPATGAIPVATAIMHNSVEPRSVFYIRPYPKDHGKTDLIEGSLSLEVALVDDTCTTGTALLRAARAVEQAGSHVRQIIVIFERGNGGLNIKNAGYRYQALIRFEDGEPVL